MKSISKEEFLKNSQASLGEIYDLITAQPLLDINQLDSTKTCLVIVDMINGFAREGALKSSRIENLIPEISWLSKKCDEKGIKKIAFADCHDFASPEFNSYPTHCIKGTHESEIVDEIREIGGYTKIAKNSTNGFLEEEFQNWLSENMQINTFVVVGDCTDICVQQFAITLKTWFNMQNKNSRIIIPINMVDTYDIGTHNGDLMNACALYNMFINGIELVYSK
jgi:nicotinamidase-related amidase